jgi:hypothetical protein
MAPHSDERGGCRTAQGQQDAVGSAAGTISRRRRTTKRSTSMALGVLNNLSAIYAENSLNNTSSSLQTVLQQLSSGSRINSGADDAAGLSLVNGLKANSTALGHQRHGRRRPPAGRRRSPLPGHQPPRPCHHARHRGLQRHPQQHPKRRSQQRVSVDTRRNQQYWLYHHL